MCAPSRLVDAIDCFRPATLSLVPFTPGRTSLSFAYSHPEPVCIAPKTLRLLGQAHPTQRSASLSARGAHECTCRTSPSTHWGGRSSSASLPPYLILGLGEMCERSCRRHEHVWCRAERCVIAATASAPRRAAAQERLPFSAATTANARMHVQTRLPRDRFPAVVQDLHPD